MSGYCIMSRHKLTRGGHLDLKENIARIKDEKIKKLTEKLTNLSPESKEKNLANIKKLDDAQSLNDLYNTYYEIDKQIDTDDYIGKYGHLDAKNSKRAEIEGAIHDWQRDYSSVRKSDLPKNLQTILNSLKPYTGTLPLGIGKGGRRTRKRSRRQRSKKRSSKKSKKRSTKKRSTKK